MGSFTNAYVGTTARISTNFYPNGQTTTFSYYGNTNDQRMQTIWHKNGTGSTLSKFDYTYDADGQIATWTEQADAQTPTVMAAEYDPVDQLIGATVHSNSVMGAVLKQFAYGYDKGGNRTSETIGTSSTSAQSTATLNNLNQLTGSTGGGQTRFEGSLNEMGTVTVAGNAATFDSRNSNFVGYAATSIGTNIIQIVATDYSKAFQADSASRNIPGSFAQYEKQVDAAGNTLQYTKTTFGPNGEIIHVKDKIGGGTFP